LSLAEEVLQATLGPQGNIDEEIAKLNKIIKEKKLDKK